MMKATGIVRRIEEWVCSQKARNERIVNFANLSEKRAEICHKLNFQNLIVADFEFFAFEKFAGLGTRRGMSYNKHNSGSFFTAGFMPILSKKLRIRQEILPGDFRVTEEVESVDLRDASAAPFRMAADAVPRIFVTNPCLF